MSIATWKKEFYPISASRCSKTGAAEHSLRKWLGLRKAALKKHGLTKIPGRCVITDGRSRFWFDCDTCSLCRKYPSKYHECDCPIVRLLDVTCYAACGRWQDHGDARPMLTLLRRVVEAQRKENQR